MQNIKGTHSKSPPAPLKGDYKNILNRGIFAFTLVELIVVVTILAVLGTIAFISLQGFAVDARDSARTSDLKNIEKALVIHRTEGNIYPDPEGAQEFTYSGSTVWFQGTFGQTALRELNTMSKIPVDPLTETEYTYSVTSIKNEFQVAGALEGSGLSMNNIVTQETHALGSIEGSTITVGDYNGMVAKTSTDDTTYILAIPTIISGDISLLDISTLVAAQKLAYNDTSVIPGSYEDDIDSNFDDTQILDYNPSPLLLFEGNVSDLEIEANQVTFLKNLQDAYSGSIVASLNEEISNITTVDLSDISNPSDQVKSLASNIINNDLKIDVPNYGSEEYTSTTLDVPSLISKSAFTYEGSFKISASTYGNSRASSSVGPLAYNYDSNTLFMVGHTYDKSIGEFSIPELKKDVEPIELAIADNISPFRSVLLEGDPNQIRGMYYEDNKIMISLDKSSDYSNSLSSHTLILDDTTNFATSSTSGYYEMEGGRKASGYISRVPDSYISDLGSTHITGAAPIVSGSFRSRYSAGPSMYGFNFDDIGDLSEDDIINTNAFLSYTTPGSVLGGTEIGSSENTASLIWNALSEGTYGFIIPGTKTFAVFGESGGIDSGIGYNFTQDNGRYCYDYCPLSSSDYHNYFWFYNVDDIISADNIYSLIPYEYGEIDIPYAEDGTYLMNGATYDSQNNMLYIALLGAGNTSLYDEPTLISAYSVDIQ